MCRPQEDYMDSGDPIEVIALVMDEVMADEAPRIKPTKDSNIGWCDWCEVSVLITESEIDHSGAWCPHCGNGLRRGRRILVQRAS